MYDVQKTFLRLISDSLKAGGQSGKALEMGTIIHKVLECKKEDVGPMALRTGLLGYQGKKRFLGEFSHRHSKHAAYR
jgi:hypothetical protein